MLKILEVIEHFLRESQRTEGDSNHWVLARDPNQTKFKVPTYPRIRAFETGFNGYSTDALVSWIENLPEKHHPRFLSLTNFAILDDRTLRDETVSIQTWVEQMPADSKEEDWDPSKVIRYWKEFRVPFLYATHLVTMLEFRPAMYIEELDMTTAFVDPNGILRTPHVKLKEWDLVEDDSESDPDLPSREER